MNSFALWGGEAEGPAQGDPSSSPLIQRVLTLAVPAATEALHPES